ncbi:hypothetical protein [Marinilabilia salmonicolor]|uniref:Uncharacterized protein n=1 Tax=Marinilabilia salmonicolor TaxID=989 RepID=A0A368V6S4_9BACT|nr:hypothetical protein [Marinilabilia salmonicolor]RCW36792.1 hypothetical protein DFO77_10783 [Marinilabilia salmonicolor]
MRSKTFHRILDKAPKEVEVKVRRYAKKVIQEQEQKKKQAKKE